MCSHVTCMRSCVTSQVIGVWYLVQAGWLAMDTVLHHLRLLENDIRRTIDEGAVTLARIDSHIALTERVLRGITVMLSSDCVTPYMETPLRSTQQVMNTLLSIEAHLAQSSEMGHNQIGFYATVRFGGRRGRPRIDITEEVLMYFLDHDFSAVSIAMLLRVSLSTIRRRMSEFGLSVRSNYSAIPDDELDRLITIQYEHPNCGYRLMRGYLTTLGQSATRTHKRGNGEN